MILVEFDLAGAEWVVVAYLANDPNMIEVVESGKSPHIVTGALITDVPEPLVIADHKLLGNATDPGLIAQLRREKLPELIELHEKDAIFLPRSMSIRQSGKKSNHGLNYGMKYRRAALEWEIMESEAAPIVAAYTEVAYPGIPKWWEATRQTMKENDRTLTNCFGRKVRLLGEWGSDLFDKAYSFVPQSTVVDIVLEAMCAAFEDTSEPFQRMNLGAQVHDSLMALYPTDNWGDLTHFCHQMVEYMRPELNYGGHTFRLNVDIKVGISWGDMHSVKTPEEIPEVYAALVASERPRLASDAAEKAEWQTLYHPDQEAHLQALAD